MSRMSVLVTVVAVLLAAAPAPAQNLGDGKESFDRAMRGKLSDNNLKTRLLTGVSYADSKDREVLTAIDIISKETVWPIYWTRGATSKPSTKDAIVQLYSTRLEQMSNPKVAAQTAPMQQLLCSQFIKRCEEIFKVEKDTTADVSLNAARMLALLTDRKRNSSGMLQAEKQWVDAVLPRMAGKNAQQLATTGLDLLQHKNATAGAKYYLYRALANLLALPPQSPPLLPKETEDNVLRAGLTLVEKKVPFPKAASRGEVEGYKMLRLQGVRVLAASRTPALGEAEKIALTLGRVAVGDPAIEPAPRTEERLVATIGLTRLTTLALKSKGGDFQPEYAVEVIGQAIQQFAVIANANNQESKAPTRIRPWKEDASLLLESLLELKATTKNAYVQKVIKEAEPILADLEAGNQAREAANFGDWLKTNQASARSLFKSDPASVVKTGAVAAED